LTKKAILVNIPITETLYPSSSLAAIVPVFKKHQFDVVISDINLLLSTSVDSSTLEEIHRWCEFSGDLSIESRNKLIKWLEDQISLWTQHSPTCVAVSVFSYHSIMFAQIMLPVIKRNLPNVQIIVGGSGVTNNLDEKTDNQDFGQQILANHWADHVIYGEGELTLDSLLSGNHHPGLNQNNPQQIDNLDLLSSPDYSNFDFTDYRDNRLLITGSRGCVRHCTFCDIDTIWPKFRYRSPQQQVEEIIAHSKKYNIKRFEFTDSLINGSINGWIKFNDLLANAKSKDPDLADITYSGQFICRDQQSQPAIMYELMHYAGARQITVGIESFSERIRDLMKKKFSNQSIDYHLEQCARWGIPNIFLMLVGHPDELLEDHQANLDALYRYQFYSKMGTIFMMRWGTTMHLLKGTALYDEHRYALMDQSMQQSDNIYAWINPKNPRLTLAERVRRRLELHCTTYDLGYSQPNSKAELATLNSLLNKYSNVRTVFAINQESQ
jgi:radical SAM superfamily enzyme YgiQ (UPF0313 family)